MFDFNQFIDTFNNNDGSMEVALNQVKDIFNIGKLVIKGDHNFKQKDYMLSESDNKALLTYSSNGFKYLLYSDKSERKYSEEDMNDLKMLLKLIGIYHYNIVLKDKEEEAKYTSLNTKLPNTFGYLKKITDLQNKINLKEYNAYYINIKGFGLINKLFGVEEGDYAIKEYANQLKDFMNEDEVLGHLSGDNFVAIIKRNRHQQFIDIVNSCPVELKKDNKKVMITITGVVGYYEIEDNIDPVFITTQASIACQYARSAKKKMVKRTKELASMVDSVMAIEKTFREELEKGAFVIYYQPKFDIKTGKIIGVETLSRWINNGNVVPPGLFVPILEKNGDIVELDLYVLDHLCQDIHNYRNLGNPIVPASCNLSRSDFNDEYLEDRIISIIHKYNVKSEDIILEVTETTNLDENERLAKFITKMHQNGIRTSIDDFGTGYSSLSVLRDFKVNEIKIDRSFINREILTDSDEIIIGSIIDMAKRLNINIICEGVETKEQADFLVKLGCNSAQGFLYSKPIPKVEFEALLAQNRGK